MFKVKTLSWLALVSLIFVTACSSATSAQRISLFNGHDISQWQQPLAHWTTAKSVSLNPTDAHLFVIEPGDGILVNGPLGHESNIESTTSHGDCRAHIEFMVTSNSNSGVYFQGRYEVQILDSWGVSNDHLKYGDCGGIYQRWKNDAGYEGHAPLLNASKRPGEWQTFDVIFRAPRFDASGKKTENARFVKVVHNGKVIHKNAEVTGATRSPAHEKETASGAIMLQGNHGPVAFRNLWIEPMEIK